jgi:nickel/cobalt transporter (NicO) family protein
MSTTLPALCLSALAIGVFHTLVGPDHYLPFVALSKARHWTRRKTMLVTAGFGFAHTLGTVLLGTVGLMIGLELGWLTRLEALRGDLAATGLLAVGLLYTGWAVWRLVRHRYTHHHSHPHPHCHDHARPLPTPMLSWSLFLVFVFGPCEALIPLLMYPAAHHDALGVVLVTGVFVLATVSTMLAAVTCSRWGLDRMKVESLAPYADVLAGATLTACGGAILAGL